MNRTVSEFQETVVTILQLDNEDYCGNESSLHLDLDSELENKYEFSTEMQNNSNANNQCQTCTNTLLLNSIFTFKIIVLSTIVLLTICGNVLVIAAVIVSRNLRSSTHYLIVNLAVADLLLGTAVLPFSAVLEVSNVWYFGQHFCEVWAAVDVLCCTASIWSLCVISIDRYIGVTKPLAYSTIMTEKRICVLIAIIWGLSFVISIGPILGWKAPTSPDPEVCSVNEEVAYVFFSVVGSFYLPGFCIVAVYWKIYKAACKQSKFLESGIKTTTSDITLRVHTGGGTSRKSSTSSTTKMTLRAHRGGHYGSVPAHMETSVTLNGTVIELDPSSLDTNKHICSKTAAREQRERSMSVSKSQFLLPVSRNEHQWNQLHPEDAMDINCRKLSGDSQISTPERKMSGLPGRIAKFRRQKKAAQTLGIVVGVFLLCWFPFFFVLPLASLCVPCRPEETVFGAIFWLGYFNSCLNPFIYAATSREFKRTFKRILCPRRWHRERAMMPAFSFTSSFKRCPRKYDKKRTSDPNVQGHEMSDRMTPRSSRSCSCEIEMGQLVAKNSISCVN